MTTTDEAALLAAIEASPDEDSVRLAYADWLDEDAAANPVRVTCPKCKGTRYRGYGPKNTYTKVRCECGTGTAPDPSRAARAEFIRVQCELAAHGPCLMCTKLEAAAQKLGLAAAPRCSKVEPLRARESALREEHGESWRKGPCCEACRGKGRKPITNRGGGTVAGYTCPDCHGTGDAGGLMQRYTPSPISEAIDPAYPWAHRVEWHRGFPRVHATLAEVYRDECPQCGGYGGLHSSRDCTSGFKPTPTAWLAAVVRHHRGVELVVDSAVLPPEIQAYKPAMSDEIRATGLALVRWCRHYV